jgi:hypothetical protein
MPARGYSWPPFQPGQQAALKHGTRVADRAEQVADQVEAIAAQVARQYPWTANYEADRLAYARAVVDERDVRTYLDRVGVVNSEGKPRPAVNTLERFAARAARLRSSLGITPTSHARLLQMVSDVVARHPDRTPVDGSLDELLAEGRAALERGAPARLNPGGDQSTADGVNAAQDEAWADTEDA